MVPVVAAKCAVPMHVVCPTVCRELRSDHPGQWVLPVTKDPKAIQVFVGAEEIQVAQEKMDLQVLMAEKVYGDPEANLVHVSTEQHALDPPKQLFP